MVPVVSAGIREKRPTAMLKHAIRCLGLGVVFKRLPVVALVPGTVVPFSSAEGDVWRSQGLQGHLPRPTMHWESSCPS